MRSILGPRCYVHFDEDLCTGCTFCVKACPTRALRIKHSKSARIVDTCIGCGECLRVCPTGALTASTTKLKEIEKDQISVAIVSPVFYAQFPEMKPQDVLRGLRQLGFQYAMDMSHHIEMFQCATQEFIEQNRITREAPWPLISPACPVVLRLIDFQFPSLIPHVLPFFRPTALLARDTKLRITQELGVPEDAVVQYHITPNKSSLPHERSNVDKVLGINDVYRELVQRLKHPPKYIHTRPTPRDLDFNVTGNGMLWGISGGEVAGLETDRTLAISGLNETIAYLQKIELGLFSEMEYIEFRSCPEGCIGGRHTAVDKYLGKSTLQKLARMLGVGKQVTRDDIIGRYNDRWFRSEKNGTDPIHWTSTRKERLTIETLQEIDQTVELLKGKDCALCGAPDCRTFAEDVVRGRATMDECFLVQMREAAGKSDDEE